MFIQRTGRHRPARPAQPASTAGVAVPSTPSRTRAAPNLSTRTGPHTLSCSAQPASTKAAAARAQRYSGIGAANPGTANGHALRPSTTKLARPTSTAGIAAPGAPSRARAPSAFSRARAVTSQPSAARVHSGRSTWCPVQTPGAYIIDQRTGRTRPVHTAPGVPSRARSCLSSTPAVTGRPVQRNPPPLRASRRPVSRPGPGSLHVLPAHRPSPAGPVQRSPLPLRAPQASRRPVSHPGPGRLST